MTIPTQIDVATHVVPTGAPTLFGTITDWSPMVDVYVDPQGARALGTRWRAVSTSDGVDTVLGEGVYNDPAGRPQRVLSVQMYGTGCQLFAVSPGISSATPITAALVGWDPLLETTPAAEQANSTVTLTTSPATLGTIPYHPSVTVFVDGTSAPNALGALFTLQAIVAGMPGPIPVQTARLSSVTVAQPVIENFVGGASQWAVVGSSGAPPGGPITCSIFGSSVGGSSGGAGLISIQNDGVALPGTFTVLDFNALLHATDAGGGVASIAIQTPYVVTLAHVGANLVQLGQSLVMPAFTATYTRPPVTAILTDNNGNPPTSVIGTPTAFSSPFTFVKNVNAQSVTFTLTGSDGGSTGTANVTITWGLLRHYGQAPAGALDAAFIAALPQSSIGTTRVVTFTATAGVTDYLWYAVPTAFGTPTFTVGGFSGGFNLVASGIAVTNAFGNTTNYDIWQSQNIDLGLTTVAVT